MSTNILACNEQLSCDFSACYDDLEFTKRVVNDVSKMYCIDEDSIHMSGISNGGMFMYYAGTYVTQKLYYFSCNQVTIVCVCEILDFISAAEMSDIIASIAPISGSPFLGFDHIPHSPVSVIDFHGTDDETIPYDLNR